MLDSKLLRTELDETAEKLARRGFKLDVDAIRTLEEQRKSIQVEVENLQSPVILFLSRLAKRCLLAIKRVPRRSNCKLVT